MKTLSTLFVACLTLSFANVALAQMGIGTTTPDASSMLELKSTAKGMLVPRMTLAQKTAIASPATGLLVYQTNGLAGFWYYDGTKWVYLSTANAWALTGNDGTTDGVNFIGTTDDVALNFRVGNVAAGRIGDVTEGNTMFGYSAGLNNTFNGSTFIGYNTGLTNSSGTGNTALGWSALKANSVGANNTAVGYASMYTTSTGLDNTACGTYTLYLNSTGSQNTACGTGALYTNLGDGNSALGQNALYTNSSGTYNSALGVNGLRLCTSGNRNVAAGYNALQALTTANNNIGIGYTAGSTITTGSNNTFVGANADASANNLTNASAFGYNAKVNASNCLVLGNTTAGSLVKVGISVASPSNTLSFDGTAARTIAMERNSSSGTGGFSLTVQSGGAATAGANNLAGGDLILSSGISTGTNTSNIYFKVPTAGASGSTDNTPATKMTILAGGNVGINNTTPGATLDVNGSVSNSGVHTSSAATYQITASDYCVINTGAASTWTWPTTTVNGKILILVNQGTGAITTSSAYRTASATTTTSIAAGTTVQLIYDNANTIWRKIN